MDNERAVSYVGVDLGSRLTSRRRLVHGLHSIDEDIEPVWLRLEQFCRTLA